MISKRNLRQSIDHKMYLLYYKFSVIEPWETTQTENPCIIKGLPLLCLRAGLC